MIKGLLNLDENLASSIALRYVSHLAGRLEGLQLQMIHVEKPDVKPHSAGYGWVRRTWEKGVREAGMLAITRLLKTENVQFPYWGSPKVLIGEREAETLSELQENVYDLYIEGNLNTSNKNDFYDLVTSRLYADSPCPVMIVKNLVNKNSAVLVCGDGVDRQALIKQFLGIMLKAQFDVDLLYYKFQENDEPVFLEKSEAGSTLAEAEALLAENNVTVGRSEVVSGTPETVGDYLQKYDLVVSTFPTRKSPRLELLAHTSSSVMLCK